MPEVSNRLIELNINFFCTLCQQTRKDFYKKFLSEEILIESAPDLT